MDIKRIPAAGNIPLERVYIIGATLKNFRGKKDVEAHIFRAESDARELDALRGRNLVGEADPAMPLELLAGATEDAALECLLEAFTAQESEAVAKWLEARYDAQISSLVICPITLPVPLGVGPLGKIPESETSGFIYFDQAKNYPLPFKIRAYFELAGDSSNQA